MTGRVALAAAVAVVLGLGAALPVPAAAQSAQSLRARAAARFKQGQEFFKVGDYDHAIVEYEAAYQLSAEPLLIFNIALCHDRAGRSEDALAAFQRYLDLAPTGAVADEAREDVARLVPIVEARRARRAAEAAAAEAAERRDQAARAAEAAERDRRARERRDAHRRDVAERSERLERRSQLERWGGIAAGALGAVALGVATKYGLDARSAAEAISAHQGPWTDRDLARDAEGQRAQTRMIVFTSLGGAAVIGGGVLYLIGRGHDTEASRLRLELQPQPAGGSIAVSGALSGRF